MTGNISMILLKAFELLKKISFIISIIYCTSLLACGCGSISNEVLKTKLFIDSVKFKKITLFEYLDNNNITDFFRARDLFDSVMIQDLECEIKSSFNDYEIIVDKEYTKHSAPLNEIAKFKYIYVKSNDRKCYLSISYMLVDDVWLIDEMGFSNSKLIPWSEMGYREHYDWEY